MQLVDHLQELIDYKVDCNEKFIVVESDNEGQYVLIRVQGNPQSLEDQNLVFDTIGYDKSILKTYELNKVYTR